jgi:hypothetical protein
MGMATYPFCPSPPFIENSYKNNPYGYCTFVFLYSITQVLTPLLANIKHNHNHEIV